MDPVISAPWSPPQTISNQAALRLTKAPHALPKLSAAYAQETKCLGEDGASAFQPQGKETGTTPQRGAQPSTMPKECSVAPTLSSLRHRICLQFLSGSVSSCHLLFRI